MELENIPPDSTSSYNYNHICQQNQRELLSPSASFTPGLVSTVKEAQTTVIDDV